MQKVSGRPGWQTPTDIKNFITLPRELIHHHFFVVVEEPKGWQQPSALDQRGNVFVAGISWMKLFC